MRTIEDFGTMEYVHPAITAGWGAGAGGLNALLSNAMVEKDRERQITDVVAGALSGGVAGGLGVPWLRRAAHGWPQMTSEHVQGGIGGLAGLASIMGPWRSEEEEEEEVVKQARFGASILAKACREGGWCGHLLGGAGLTLAGILGYNYLKRDEKKNDEEEEKLVKKAFPMDSRYLDAVIPESAWDSFDFKGTLPQGGGDLPAKIPPSASIEASRPGVMEAIYNSYLDSQANPMRNNKFSDIFSGIPMNTNPLLEYPRMARKRIW